MPSLLKAPNGVDESFVFEYVTTNMTGNILDMERVCLQLDNSMKVETLQLVATQSSSYVLETTQWSFHC
jgi:hypothetical protein